MSFQFGTVKKPECLFRDFYCSPVLQYDADIIITPVWSRELYRICPFCHSLMQSSVKLYTGYVVKSTTFIPFPPINLKRYRYFVHIMKMWVCSFNNFFPPFFYQLSHLYLFFNSFSHSLTLYSRYLLKSIPWNTFSSIVAEEWQCTCAFCTITKTYLYNFDPFKPHFYIVKLGFTGVYIIFLISAQKHRLWVLVRTASPRRF